MIIVGISGKAGSGKDTIGDHLVSHYGFGKDGLSFPLKKAVLDIFSLEQEQIYDRIEREQPLANWPGWTGRKLLQYVATELFRDNIDEHIWLKSLCLRLDNKPGLWVVTDIRFPNERVFLKKLYGDNFVGIRVEREGHNGAPSGIPGHLSEKYEVDADHVIVNDGDLPSLYYKVDSIMEKIGLEVIPSNNGASS